MEAKAESLASDCLGRTSGELRSVFTDTSDGGESFTPVATSPGSTTVTPTLNDAPEPPPRCHTPSFRVQHTLLAPRL
jgi:hypothetical protein